ncbi:hypothetical protein CsSME_00032102 [Camellia sinensis var. sinensis]
MKMGLVGGWVWVNNYSKKQCRRLRAALKKAVKKAVKINGGGGGKQQFKFRYDPWSYALNFDDGFSSNFGDQQRNAFHNKTQLEDFHETFTWVYVLWV